MSSKYHLTLAVILLKEQVLLLNRYKKPFIGQWNGVGGKIEAGESPQAGIQREIREETGILPQSYQLHENGALHWYIDGHFQDIIYLFAARLLQDYPLKTPIAMQEGLLQLFPTDWVLQPENLGIIADLKAILPYLLKDEVHQYYTDFHQDQLITFKIDDSLRK